MKGVIYKWTCIPSGKSYIGQTKNEKRRERVFLDKHKSYAGAKINNARKKYGLSKDVWKKTVLKRLWCKDGNEDLLTERLNFWEKYYIEKYDTVNNGYNMTDGGESGFILSEEVIQKIKENCKLRWDSLSDEEKRIHIAKCKDWWNNLSEEGREELRVKSRNAQSKWYNSLSEDEKAAMREKSRNAAIGKKNGHSYDKSKQSSIRNKGKARDESTKNKIRNTLCAKDKLDKISSKVYQYSLETNEIINEYSSIKEASAVMGVKSTTFSNGIKRRGGVYRGYLWKTDEVKRSNNPKGCYFIERIKRWRSVISIKKEKYLLGHFEKIESAKQIREEAEIEKLKGTFNEWYEGILEHRVRIYKENGEKIQ